MSTEATAFAVTIPAGGSQPQRLTAGTGSSVLIYASSTNSGSVYIGGSDVTSSNGVPVSAGAYIAVDTPDAGNLYLAGTQNDTVRVLVTGRTA
jgi:hypothetical protein